MNKLKSFVNIFLVFIFIETNRCHENATFVNGSLAKYGEFPFVVLLFKKSLELRAVGTLISNLYVLSTAYQFTGKLDEKLGYAVAGDIKLRGRAKGRELRNIKKYFINPLFYETDNLPDFAVAVLKMEKPFVLSHTVQTITLANSILYDQAHAIGLRLEESNVSISNLDGHLRWDRLILDINYCGFPHRLIYCALNEYNFYAHGDPGSPLIYPKVNAVQYGVLTMVSMRRPNQSYAVLYTDVALNRFFINQILQKGGKGSSNIRADFAKVVLLLGYFLPRLREFYSIQ